MKKKTPESFAVPSRISAVILGLFALSSIPALVLLPIAGWPDFAQGASAGEALPTIRENFGAFRAGYLLFAITGLLFWPATLLIIRVLAGSSDRDSFGHGGLLLSLAGGLAIASAATRSAWYAASLTAFPILDRLWQDAETAATRDAIDVVFIVLNDVLSTVQEDVGVNLLGATSGIIISAIILTVPRAAAFFPRWLGVMGLVGSLMYVASSAELLRVDLGPVGEILPIAAPTISNFWYLFLGIVIWRRGVSAMRGASKRVV